MSFELERVDFIGHSSPSKPDPSKDITGMPLSDADASAQELLAHFQLLYDQSVSNSDFLDAAITVGFALVVPSDGTITNYLATPHTASIANITFILESISLNTVQKNLDTMRALSVLFHRRSENTGTLHDIDISIAIRRRCADAKSDDTAVDNASLCDFFISRFKKDQEFETISAAIFHGRESIGGLYRGHPRHLSNLAIAFQERFIHFRTEDDLETSIALVRSALDISERSQLYDADYSRNLRNILCASLLKKAGFRNQSATVLEECVQLMRQVIATMSPDNPHYSMYQYNLAVTLATQFEHSGDNSNIQTAISLLTDLVNSGSGPTVTWRMVFMAKLGFVMHDLYKSSQEAEDLYVAVEVVQKAIDCFPEANLSQIQTTKSVLFMMYWERYKMLLDPHDLEALFALSGDHDWSYPPSIQMRILTLMQAAFFNHAYDRFDAAMVDYEMALNLLPQYLVLGKKYRTTALEEYRMESLASMAAASCIECGCHSKALELLELGRSIGWTRSLQMRHPLQELESIYPEYAVKLKDLSEALEESELAQVMSQSTTTVIEPLGTEEPQWERHFNMSQRWNALLSEIRNLDGFDQFLRGSSYDQLKLVSEQGPVVVINICKARSDAIVLTMSAQDRPQIVSLADNLFENAYRWSIALSDALQKVEDGSMLEAQFSQHVLKPILANLWRDIVWPVRQVLNSLAPYARRMWWCPTGRLTSLPLHLVTNGVNPVEMADAFQLIPSFATTLSSLLRARSSLKQGGSINILSVSCEKADSFDVIPGTVKEIDDIASVNHSDCAISSLQGSDATVSTVLAEMPQASWLHLACHGIQVVDEPYRSYFALSDGPLYLADIAGARLDHAQFAFLSACQTATGIPVLGDEAMHLAASLQFAGFCGTIASMWSVHDSTARRLARQVYKILLHDASPSTEDAAEALWKASRILLRKRVPLSRLAPFIHIGV